MNNNYIQSKLNLGDSILSGKPRNLINGKKAKSYPDPIDLVVHTRAPEKWKLIDLETGQEYIGTAEPNEYGCWVRVKDREYSDTEYYVDKELNIGYWSSVEMILGENT